MVPVEPEPVDPFEAVEPVDPVDIGEPIEPFEPKPEIGDDGEMTDGDDYMKNERMMGNISFLMIAVG